MKDTISIRNALPSDLAGVIELDKLGSKEEKPDSWRKIFSHYVATGKNDRLFLVAEANGKVVGFIVGEVRAWEFGSPSCGWVFAVAVSPKVRETGIGRRMFDEISVRLKQSGLPPVVWKPRWRLCWRPVKSYRWCVIPKSISVVNRFQRCAICWLTSCMATLPRIPSKRGSVRRN